MNKSELIRTSLDVLFYSGASRLLTPVCRGEGAIFMLHHVRPGGGRQKGFAPNNSLEITPEFLANVINHVRRRGYEILSISQFVSILKSGRQIERPFVVFTIDDGSRDIFVHAWPVFRKHQCPFTIFIAPAMADGVCELWWRGLESVIAGDPHLNVTINGEHIELPTLTDAQKRAAWNRLYSTVRNMSAASQHAFIDGLCRERGIDLNAICRAESMNWHELRTLIRDPLCSVGAHSVHHYSLARLSAENAMVEIEDSGKRIEKELGRFPRWFAYPYGDRSAAGHREFELAGKVGFEAAFTTRHGLIFRNHGETMTSLPRIPLNGRFQELRYVDVLLSGAPFALFNGLRRLQIA